MISVVVNNFVYFKWNARIARWPNMSKKEITLKTTKAITGILLKGNLQILREFIS